LLSFLPFLLGRLEANPPLECIFGHIPFSRRWDKVRYSGIQLDTARYVRIQLDTDTVWDTAGYSGSAAKWLDIDRYREIHGDTLRIYGEMIQAGYR